jgi:hypothetical protein
MFKFSFCFSDQQLLVKSLFLPVNLICVFVEELSRAEEVSAVPTLDPLVRFALGAAARCLAGILVVTRVHLVRGRAAPAMNWKKN